ncbi:myc box-dependent-interacting protein 1 isoform X3 [Panulirus ornatus]|uniref:myc box-dependent-interacting protein 1 isoform X3 n=1 Tax=Panulirus ornatus TaxID=150431 RepID=UPI003A8A3C62
MMELEEVIVEDSPNTKRHSTNSTLDSPPSSPSTPQPPSPPDPTSPTTDLQNHEHAPPPSSPTSPSSAAGPPTPGLGGRRLPNIRIKKQYSKIFRIKTKILQNLGKADRTVDDVFDEYELNFNKQQTNANRIHKEVANYLRCCRALHGASKGLFETLADVYEPEWVGHELLYAQAQNSDMLWTDFCHKVQDQTLTPLTAYQQQFPEIRKKIDKRGRKLVDYDSQRHQLENLQRANRRDEYKIARSRDALETARVTYEALNKELYDELPTLYDERIPIVAAHLQSLFAAEATVMVESSKVAKELEAIADKLAKECEKGTYKVKRAVAPRPLSVVEPSSPKNANSPSMWYDGGAVEEGGNSLQALEGSEGTLEISTTEDNQDSSDPLEHKESYKSIPDSVQRTPTPPASPLPLESPTNDADSAPSAPSVDSQPDTNNRPTISGPVTPNKEETGRPYEEIEFEDKKVNGTVSAPARTNGEVIGTKIPADGGKQPSPLTGATTEGLPPGVLYRVRATYKYTREDVDEISFEIGDIIQVVEYDDPEEQEEGWLTGVKEATSEKGLFPANFTRPI